MEEKLLPGFKHRGSEEVTALGTILDLPDLKLKRDGFCYVLLSWTFTASLHICTASSSTSVMEPRTAPSSPPQVLKTCADQPSEIQQHLFTLGLSQEKVLVVLKVP